MSDNRVVSGECSVCGDPWKMSAEESASGNYVCVCCIFEAKKQRRKARKPEVLVGPKWRDGKILICHDPQVPTLWRAYYFDSEENPTGHFGPYTFEEVLEDASVSGDSDMLSPFIPA